MVTKKQMSMLNNEYFPLLFVITIGVLGGIIVLLFISPLGFAVRGTAASSTPTIITSSSSTTDTTQTGNFFQEGVELYMAVVQNSYSNNEWVNCDVLMGGVSSANNFCICKGYDGVYNAGASACYKQTVSSLNTIWRYYIMDGCDFKIDLAYPHPTANTPAETVTSIRCQTTMSIKPPPQRPPMMY